MKGPRSELARGRIGQAPIGRFVPGSDLAPGAKRLGTVRAICVARFDTIPMVSAITL